MSKRRKGQEQFVRATASLPPWGKPSRIGLTDEDRRLLSSTYLRLADLVHACPKDQADCLLLLTTCRNQWYTLNAMYAEARKWCREGGNSSGYGDALDVLSTAISRNKDLNDAAQIAARVLEVTAAYLQEFEKKKDLFFNRFDDVRSSLRQYGEGIKDAPARSEFFSTFVSEGNGPGADDALHGPEEPENDVNLSRLEDWFALARPLTSLTRTYITDVLGVGRRPGKAQPCEHYLRQIEAADLLWEARGFRCLPIPGRECFQAVSGISAEEGAERERRFVEFFGFCGGMLAVAKVFLAEMLPVDKDRPEEGFLLKRPRDLTSVSIGGRHFEICSMFVLITDMRNSVGPELTPELKVKVEEIIDRLRNQGDVHSQLVYDDCRVLAFRSVESLSRCARRLHEALIPYETTDGFGGIRAGMTYGEMLFGFESSKDWRELRRHNPPLDSADNTIAAAARLMASDKTRWGDSEQAKVLRKALGDWADDRSLLFLGSRLYEHLEPGIRERCRDCGVLEFKGIGRRQCWAIPVAAVEC